MGGPEPERATGHAYQSLPSKELGRSGSRRAIEAKGSRTGQGEGLGEGKDACCSGRERLPPYSCQHSPRFLPFQNLRL